MQVCGMRGHDVVEEGWEEGGRGRREEGSGERGRGPVEHPRNARSCPFDRQNIQESTSRDAGEGVWGEIGRGPGGGECYHKNTRKRPAGMFSSWSQYDYIVQLAPPAIFTQL